MKNVEQSSNVEDYIEATSKEISAILRRMRDIVRLTAPDAVESISYGMPAYKLNGKPLIYFAAQKAHLGLYATPSGHEAFAAQLSGYKQGKGSVQFPYADEIPWDLIREIVEFRVKENLEK